MNITSYTRREIEEGIQSQNHSGLLNYLYSGSSRIKGPTAFIAAILVAGKWKVDLTFLESEQDQYGGSLLTAYADRQRVFYS